MTADMSKEMTKAAYHVLEDHKGEDITVLDISNVSIVADYFIIVTADNIRHVGALSDAGEDKMAEPSYPMRRREGTPESGWILLDYNDVIIHIFNKEQRIFYDLERIWSDGKKIVNIDEL